MNISKPLIIFSLIAAVIFSASDIRSENTLQKKQDIADRLYEIELMGGDHLNYCREILQHLEKSSGIRPGKYKSNTFDDIDRQNLKGKDLDLYSLLSGGLAIRESLQLESIRPSDDGMRDIDPAGLNLVDIKSHPFEKMLKDKDYKIYPVDRYVPEDFYYIHFNSALKIFNVISLLNSTGGALYSRFSSTSVDFMIKEKLMTQLAISDTKEFESFYSSAISEIVITGSDPFIIEGSDVTLIIRPVPGSLFKSEISRMRSYIKYRFSADEKEIEISGLKGNHLYTENRKVWSVMVTLDDGTAIISNSVKAAQRVADTCSGKYPALSDSLDYRYMRSIYPAGKNNEDGFIYLSDKFIRYLVSPRLRIMEARRMYEAMKMSVLEKYMIFHYQLTEKLPVSIEEVMDSAGGPSLTDPRKKELDSIKKNQFYGRAVKLDKDDLSSWEKFRNALPSSNQKTKNKKKKKQGNSSEDFIYDLKMFYKKITGEQAYTPAEVIGIIEAVSKPGGLDSKRFNGISIIPGSFAARSDIYGKMNYMKPLIEIETGNISKREAEEYKKFAESYNNFWKDYFDPIGIRLKTDPVFSIETCILPLLNNSIYNLISGIAGGAPVELHPDSKITGDTLSLALKINPLMINSMITLSGLFDSNSVKPISNPENIFTGEIQFHMGDALPLADFDTAIISEFFSSDSIIRSSEVLTGFLVWSFFHPVRIALPVKKPKEGLILINSIIDRLIDRSNFNNYLQSDSYLYNYNSTNIRVLKLTFFSSLITRLYIAEKNNVINITTTEKYMKEVLDFTTSQKNLPVKGNAVIVYRPGEMKLEKDFYRAGMIENGLQKSKMNLGTMKLMSQIFPNATSAEIPELVYKNFGFKPVCPLGGDYLIDRNTGNVRNSVYGSGTFPILRIDETSNGLVPLYLKSFFRSSELRVEFEFTPEGIKTKIVSR